ncbi:putative atp-synthase s1 [Erysiphe necator]|uniref:Protein BIG1 n=1 Tax=Uncinula necator TaxID=52586 RepID=A0A0B1PHP7_UNCNE|nr:putative atp-synthase s1 [Erysiphe necator]
MMKPGSNMLLFSIALVAINIRSALAFRDTSPFVLLSNNPSSESTRQFSTDQLQSRTQVLETSKSYLSGCPSDLYYILTHPFVPVKELSNNASYLSQALKNNEFPTKILIREAVQLKADDGERIATYLEENCRSKRATGWMFNDIKAQKELDSSLVISEILDEEFKESHTSIFENVLSSNTGELKYTIILLTTPPKFSDSQIHRNEKPMNTASHLELKRHIKTHKRKISKEADVRPLFEKYQFFSQGIFIGIFVTIILLSILSVGISAISGLEVSYGAFEKEQGPTISKKS